MLGTTIAHYKITTKLGQGGMGEVYRATDTKLDREVAIKLLPESFAQDRERVARLEREAKTLATLNHPNIAVIYGLEKSGASHVIRIIWSTHRAAHQGEQGHPWRRAQQPLAPEPTLAVQSGSRQAAAVSWV